VAVASAELNHMQIICTLLQTENHASTSPVTTQLFKSRMPFLPANKQCQSTEGTQSTAGTSRVKKLMQIQSVVFILLFATDKASGEQLTSNIGTPNVFLSSAYFVASSRARLATPTAPIAT